MGHGGGHFLPVIEYQDSGIRIMEELTRNQGAGAPYRQRISWEEYTAGGYDIIDRRRSKNGDSNRS